MNVNFVIFDITTGAPLRWGSCLPEAVQLQEVTADEKLLITNAFDVESNKLVVYEQVKAIRNALVDAGAPTTFGVVQSDINSRLNLTASCLAAVISIMQNLPFNQNWTMLDNTVVTFNATDMISFAMQAALHIDSIYARGIQLRTSINACTTMAELLAIDVGSGWPSPTLPPS
jgi:hypothetical protein